MNVTTREQTVQTSDAQTGRVIALREIAGLPQLERAPIVLAMFQPGVQIQGGNMGLSAVNGARYGSNAVRLDGMDAREQDRPALGFSGLNTDTDAVQEFRVITQGAKAEYGPSPGAQVDMVTRGGSNRWSANLFEYHRNTSLNANNFFNNSRAVDRPKYTRTPSGARSADPSGAIASSFSSTPRGTRPSSMCLAIASC